MTQSKVLIGSLIFVGVVGLAIGVSAYSIKNKSETKPVAVAPTAQPTATPIQYASANTTPAPDVTKLTQSSNVVDVTAGDLLSIDPIPANLTETEASVATDSSASKDLSTSFSSNASL